MVAGLSRSFSAVGPEADFAQVLSRDFCGGILEGGESLVEVAPDCAAVDIEEVISGFPSDGAVEVDLA